MESKHSSFEEQQQTSDLAKKKTLFVLVNRGQRSLRFLVFWLRSDQLVSSWMHSEQKKNPETHLAKTLHFFTENFTSFIQLTILFFLFFTETQTNDREQPTDSRLNEWMKMNIVDGSEGFNPMNGSFDESASWWDKGWWTVIS